MAQLPIDEAIVRFRSNEERLDDFVNDPDSYTNSSNVEVPSLPKVVEDINAKLNGSLILKADDYAEARALTGLTNGAQVSIGYRSALGDSGGGVFVFSTADHAAAVAADSLEGVYLSVTAGGVLVRKDTQTVSPEMFGGGQAGLQAALNSGYYVKAKAGATYNVNVVGTKTVLGFAHYYAIVLPSGARLDLNGAIVRLNNAQNCIVIINAGAGSYVDAATVLKNGVIDGNEANQTAAPSGLMPCIYQWGLSSPIFENIKVINARDHFGRFLNIDNGRFVNLYGDGSDGDGWAIGVSANNQTVRGSYLDNIRGDNCRGGASGLAGNPLVITAQKSHFGHIEGRTSAGGIKVQDLSKDLLFDSVLFIGGANGTANSGLKIQDNVGDGLVPRNITVSKAISIDSYGAGLFLQGGENIHIVSYIGENNGIVWPGPDVWVASNKVIIDRIDSRDPGTSGVVVRVDAVEYSIGKVSVINPTGSAVQVDCTDNGSIDMIEATDTQGTATMTHALFQSSVGALRVGTVKTNLPISATQNRIQFTSLGYSTISGPLIVSNAPTHGRVLLTSGATATVVASGNVSRRFIGGANNDYTHPIIEITPVNAAAMALGVMRVVATDYTAGSGFTIHHASAGANTYVYWRLIGYAVSPVHL